MWNDTSQKQPALLPFLNILVLQLAGNCISVAGFFTTLVDVTLVL
jgi:hypothetical protein